MSVPQADDFLACSNQFSALLDTLSAADWGRPTQFKQWTTNDIVGHLHMWNVGADLSLRDPDAFTAQVAAFRKAVQDGETRTGYTRRWLNDMQGPALHALWRDYCAVMAARFAAADPKARVRWVGPDMSVRSSVTARLMETWSHAQAVYDLFGVDRVSTDAVRNIAQLGVNTREWTFRNRGLRVPSVAPFVRLTAPSGVQWDWNLPSEAERIEGSAVEFCQVVTQVRNIADTALRVTGEGARQWMALAQCFAGEPNDPPAPGTRFKQ